MKFKCVIANTITTKVKGTYKDEAGAPRNFSFDLVQDRISQDDLQQIITDQTENASELIKRITRGWRDQRLVLDEDDKPAEFSAEALDVLLNISGMGGYCYRAYLDQVLVTAKN